LQDFRVADEASHMMIVTDAQGLILWIGRPGRHRGTRRPRDRSPAPAVLGRGATEALWSYSPELDSEVKERHTTPLQLEDPRRLLIG
jgi:hypothetical protein